MRGAAAIAGATVAAIIAWAAGVRAAPSADDRADAPTLAWPIAFPHPAHAALGGAGATCANCHAGVAPGPVVVGAAVPRAPLAACIGCHDGKAAFAVDASCTRCHSAAPAEPWTMPRPGPRFSHATHAPQQLACTACHALAASGEPTTIGHAACATCHRMHPDAPARTPREAKEPAVCGACHNGTEPWRHLVADRSPPDATELGSSLDHGKHPGSCASCHRRRAPDTELAMPRGHVACTGDGCHVAGGGPAPSLTTCDGCHQLGLAAARTAARTAAEWSVRAEFSHDAHGAAAATCAACHTQLAGAKLLAIPTPAKATCAPCHDGKQAFKLTGTTCRRCHGATR